MLNIIRIAIIEGQGHVNDKVYPFVSKILERRYGNAVTFCFDWEVDNIIEQFKKAGFTAYNDNYNIKLTEPDDFKIDNIIYCENFIGVTPMIVKEIKHDDIHGVIAKVKYKNYPKKHGVWIKVKTQSDTENEVSKYGLGMLRAYQEHLTK